MSLHNFLKGQIEAGTSFSSKNVAEPWVFYLKHMYIMVGQFISRRFAFTVPDILSPPVQLKGSRAAVTITV